MKREIKFRMFDKETNKYGGQSPMTWWSDGILHLDCLEHQTIEQYTGLKDKNGVEIYECDLIKVHSKYWKEPSDEVFVISFHNSVDIGSNGGEYGNIVTGYVPTRSNNLVDCSGVCEYAYGSMQSEEVIIIGNINENKELLK